MNSPVIIDSCTAETTLCSDIHTICNQPDPENFLILLIRSILCLHNSNTAANGHCLSLILPPLKHIIRSDTFLTYFSWLVGIKIILLFFFKKPIIEDICKIFIISCSFAQGKQYILFPRAKLIAIEILNISPLTYFRSRSYRSSEREKTSLISLGEYRKPLICRAFSIHFLAERSSLGELIPQKYYLRQKPKRCGALPVMPLLRRAARPHRNIGNQLLPFRRDSSQAPNCRSRNH